ncbi:MAG TPA: signal recognition particle-docking protein FtsY [Vicinamibacteria bacterium]
MTLTERLRESLRRTREKLGLSGAIHETPDWDALEESLLLADVGLPATREILDKLRARSGDFRENLRSILVEMLSRGTASSASISALGPHPQRSSLQDSQLSSVRARSSLARVAPSARAEGSTVSRPRVTMVVGVNGAGKTTSVAKLARRFASEGRKVLVVAADTFRAAAQEQLGLWAERTGVDIAGATAGRDPASVVHDALSRAASEGYDEVLVDTAGRLHTKRPLMEEIGKMSRIASRVVREAPHETLLVLDATVGANGLAQAKEFTATLPVTGIVLAKMDGTARGGVVVAIARELGVPVRYLGVGEGADDLLPFEAEAFATALVSE